MTRARVLSLIAVFVLTFIFPSSGRVQSSRSVIVIEMDSLRADHVQSYGYPRATTPNILAFSRRATVFQQAYPAASWTRPSIQSFLTGRYNSELNTSISGNAPLKANHPTLATVLRSYGYATAAFYNTAQLNPAVSNIQGGFDTFVDYGESGGADKLNARVAVGVERTINFLRSARSPAFVFLHVLDPHHPYVPQRNYFGDIPTEKYRNSYSFATGAPDFDPKQVLPCYMAKDLSTIPEMVQLYDSEIRELDVEVGRLLQFIDNDSRYRDALVIITSDHGEEFAEHGGLFHGARFYEESLRVPLIIRDPTRRYSVGRNVDSVVSQVDVLPTILDLLGIVVAPSDYSGTSLLQYFGRRGGRPRETAVIERIGCGFDPIVAVRKGPWKMIIRLTRPKVEFYNLPDDPGEKNDLAQRQTPAIRRAYMGVYATFEDWYRRVNRPLASRNGDSTPPLPADIRERLKALGYLQ
jgi:arylsulfatase A-like enzyme